MVKVVDALGASVNGVVQASTLQEDWLAARVPPSSSPDTPPARRRRSQNRCADGILGGEGRNARAERAIGQFHE